MKFKALFLSIPLAIGVCGAAFAQQQLSISPRAIVGAGGGGKIISLRINEQTSDEFSSYHGELRVGSNAGPLAYRWGGSSCPGRNLTDANKEVLALAMAQGMKIDVITKNGSQGRKCLVGFVLTP